MADWQVGDLALCISSSAGQPGSCSNLRKGGIYTVTEVRFGESILGLCFREHVVGRVGGSWIRASGFRKINPHVPDAEDEETIRLLNGEPALAARLALEISRAGIEGDGE